VLDLYSIDVHGEEYRVDSSSVTESNKSGLGVNRRTAEWTGGGAGLGALMGAVFGGGRGAGIGALAGAGGGALTQLFTRGKEISVPAETTLTFRLEQTLVLHP
jgi:outer membrane lipoprotein SlyB